MDIRPLAASDGLIDALAEILVETVANGGSVSFMHPLDPEAAREFWREALAEADAGRRVVLGAWLGADLAGTVTLAPAWQDNQRHRGEIVKLMTRPAFRGRGVARGLMREAEQAAIVRGLTLLTLDTATDGGAAGLYEGAGFSLAGVIPDYALKPLGGLTGTAIYWKRLGG
jgi:ribosomal protein S18 acetylase RimI-like enzyme